MKKRIVLAGGSGLLGMSAANFLKSRGYDISILSRGASNNDGEIKKIHWNGIDEGKWIEELNGAHSLINFTGKTINCIHNAKNKKEIVDSRINSVVALNNAIAKIDDPPISFIQCGAIGYYGNTDIPSDENTPNGNNFLASLAKNWEEEFFKKKLPNTRKVLLRIGLPLSINGGVLPPLLQLTKFYLGGKTGDGKQYLSWIDNYDLNRIFLYAIDKDNLSGIYNATSPSPVTNEEFMRTLRKVLKRPWSPPAPSLFVKIGAKYLFQTEPELALNGINSIPTKLIDSGFCFKNTDLEETLREIIKN